jgi:hypothetical protein
MTKCWRICAGETVGQVPPAMATKAEASSPSAASVALVRGITRSLNRGLCRGSLSGPEEGVEGRAVCAMTASLPGWRPKSGQGVLT